MAAKAYAILETEHGELNGHASCQPSPASTQLRGGRRAAQHARGQLLNPSCRRSSSRSPRPDDAERVEAREVLKATTTRTGAMTNFPFFLYSTANAEQDGRQRSTARRLLWEAELARTSGRRDNRRHRANTAWTRSPAWRSALLRFLQGVPPLRQLRDDRGGDVRDLPEPGVHARREPGDAGEGPRPRPVRGAGSRPPAAVLTAPIAATRCGRTTRPQAVAERRERCVQIVPGRPADSGPRLRELFALAARHPGPAQGVGAGDGVEAGLGRATCTPARRASRRPPRSSAEDRRRDAKWLDQSRRGVDRPPPRNRWLKEFKTEADWPATRSRGWCSTASSYVAAGRTPQGFESGRQPLGAGRTTSGSCRPRADERAPRPRRPAGRRSETPAPPPAKTPR